MMDWNGDGKFDRKDDAFYNNVLSNDSKSNSSNKIQTNKSTSYKTNNAPQTTSSNTVGWAWFTLFCLIWLLLRIIS